jgi:hypothetical protein
MFSAGRSFRLRIFCLEVQDSRNSEREIESKWRFPKITHYRRCGYKIAKEDFSIVFLYDVEFPPNGN